MSPERSYDGGGTTYVLLASNERTGIFRDQLMQGYQKQQDAFDEEARQAYEAEERSREDEGFGIGVRRWSGKSPKKSCVKRPLHLRAPLRSQSERL